MKSIVLDLRKLLGFKIIANEASVSQRVAIGAKLGAKEGLKPSPFRCVSAIQTVTEIGGEIEEK